MVCELVQIIEDFLFTHNKDPTNAVSAWDQMHAREEEKKKIAQEEVEKFKSMYKDEVSKSSQHANNEVNELQREKIEREYSRQKKALLAAKDKRRRKMSQDYGGDASDDNNSYDDESDFDNDDESYHQNDPRTLSRYKNDFIQLEKLGRGGGGEVVKVRNRLDKRIYAVKKVILQSEHGKMKKVGKLENAKLKREVTTISRMMHKNIVRYYQAWVEGGEKVNEGSSSSTAGGVDTISNKADVSKSILEEDSDDDSDDSDDNDDNDDNDDDTSSNQSSDSSKSRNGFWMSSFNGINRSIDSSSSWSDEEGSSSTQTPHNESQNDDFDFMQSPLMVGFGLENNKLSPSNVVNGYQKPLSNSESNDYDESKSESELDTSKIKEHLNSGRSTLYIQMEYCSSTLRNLIDDGSLQEMDNDDVWKLVIQIVEALEYMHKVRHIQIFAQ